MTTINVGDKLNLAGATTIDLMASLKDAVQNGHWGPFNLGAEVDVAANLSWRLGYQYAFASGPNNSLADWQIVNNTETAVPNVNAFDSLGTMPFSVNAAGHVVGQVRPLTSAELASMSGQSALAGATLCGAVVTTVPAGMVPPFAFSVTVKVPTFRGCWPAVWMLPDDGSWPPEIDVLEGFNNWGQSGTTGFGLTTSLHSSTPGWTEKLAAPLPGYINPDETCTTTWQSPNYPAGIVDPASEFITFTGLVYPDGIWIFYNDVCVQVYPMPTDCNIRWYLLIDYSVHNHADVQLPNYSGITMGPMEISDVAAYVMPATYGSGSGGSGAGVPSATTSTISASPATLPADGTSTTTVTTTVKDASGNPVSGASVSLSSGGGSADHLGAASGVTNASGVFSTALSSTAVQAGDVVTASVGGFQLTTSVAFTSTGGGTVSIPEILPGGGAITMTNGHVLTLTAGDVAMDNGVAIPNGSGTAALAYNSALDPNGIIGEDINNPGSWYQYTGGGAWTPIAAPTNMVVVTAPPPANTTFTPAQMTAIKAAAVKVASDLSTASADLAALRTLLGV